MLAFGTAVYVERKKARAVQTGFDTLFTQK